MASATPLLLLLDGMLRQDQDQISEAVEQISYLLSPSNNNSGDDAIHEFSPDILVSKLLDMHPHLAAIRSSHDDSLPLHFAASIGYLQLAEKILSCYPQGVSKGNNKGKLPLHYATREGRSEVVNLLITADPTTVQCPTKKKKLPLHYAVSEGHIEISEKLIDTYPAGVLALTSKGKVPLHFAARWGHLEIVETLLSIYPDSVRCQDWDGMLPLHDAAREGQVKVACRLIREYPEGLQRTTIRGELPLLAAVRKGCIELVTEMIYNYPEGGKPILTNLMDCDDVTLWDWQIIELCLRGAVGMLQGWVCKSFGKKNCMCSIYSNKANKRKYPKIDRSSCSAGDCSTAISSSKSDSELEKEDDHTKSVSPTTKRRRLNETPNKFSCGEFCSILSRCSNKFLALHAALECQSSPIVLDCVLKKHSNQVSEQDMYGMLPLHIAMTHADAPNAEVIAEKLISLNSNSTFVRDSWDRLPIHIALSNRARYPVVKALLESNRPSAFEKCKTNDEFVNVAPLFVATACDCDLDVVFLLLREDPSTLCS